MLGRRSNMGKLSVINEFLKPSLRNLEMSYTGKHDKLKWYGKLNKNPSFGDGL